jgi:DUF1680 family protein
VKNLVLLDDAPLATEFRGDLLAGVQVVTGNADRGENEQGAAHKSVRFMAVPYCVWAHRGKGEMAVWLRRNTE